MGAQKEQWIDDQNEKFYEKLADYIGITKDDMDNYGSLLKEQDGSSNTQYLEFSKDTPDHILNKIKGIDNTNTVYFSQSELEQLL